MPGYTIATLTDVPDVLGDYPGEMRMLAGRLAFTHGGMPTHPGGKGSYAHRHEHQEEIYFVISGRLQFKLGDDVVEAGAGTAIRVAAEVVRSVWNNEPTDAVLAIISVVGV